MDVVKRIREERKAELEAKRLICEAQMKEHLRLRRKEARRRLGTAGHVEVRARPPRRDPRVTFAGEGYSDLELAALALSLLVMLLGLVGASL